MCRNHFCTHAEDSQMHEELGSTKNPKNFRSDTWAGKYRERQWSFRGGFFRLMDLHV